MIYDYKIFKGLKTNKYQVRKIAVVVNSVKNELPFSVAGKDIDQALTPKPHSYLR